MNPISTDPPQPDKIERAIGLLRAAVTAVPFVGGSITELFSAFFSTPLTRRREAWFHLLALAIVELQERLPNLTPETLQTDERFTSTVLNATTSALRTHRQEKLIALRNAVTNSVLMLDVDEDLMAMFLNYVDVLTPRHLRVLFAFHDPNAHFERIASTTRWLVRSGNSETWWSTSTSTLDFMRAAFPELKDHQFTAQLITDLATRTLIGLGAIHHRLPEIGPYTTFTGAKFMKFIGSA